MNGISKTIVFTAFCLGIANVSHAVEHKALACYDESSANTARFLKYEIILGSDGYVDGLDNNASGSVTVGNKTRWSFNGNYYYWEMFSDNFRYRVDNNSLVVKPDVGLYRESTSCDRVDATLLLNRIKKIRASKKLF